MNQSIIKNNLMLFCNKLFSILIFIYTFSFHLNHIISIKLLYKLSHKIISSYIELILDEKFMTSNIDIINEQKCMI
jgi:uncharacterized membrane protein YcgQ (UPF0703/DUF1980 family)